MYTAFIDAVTYLGRGQNRRSDLEVCCSPVRRACAGVRVCSPVVGTCTPYPCPPHASCDSGEALTAASHPDWSVCGTSYAPYRYCYYP